MPVTAKLSRAFYDRLGHQVADEMVDWFNQVDAAYRSDLRDLNELNFARFDAKLEQRLAELKAELSTRFDSRLDQRAAEVSARFDAKLDQRFNELAARINDLSTQVGALSTEFARQQVVQLRWIMSGLVAVVVALIALTFRH